MEHRNHLFAAIAEQTAQLQGATISDDVVEPVCLAITQGVVAASPTAAHASITLVEHGTLVSVAATDGVADLLDQLQGQFDQGPCLDAAWSQKHMRIEDYSTEPRWPRYIAAALEQSPVRASLSFQLYRDEHSLSALNLHSDTARAFNEFDRNLGRAFAAQAALALHSEARQHQFEAALASRDTIGQAKGVLMERHDLGATAAFDMLRKTSQDLNVKVARLAEKLIEVDHPDDTQPQ